MYIPWRIDRGEHVRVLWRAHVLEFEEIKVDRDVVLVGETVGDRLDRVVVGNDLLSHLVQGCLVNSVSKRVHSIMTSPIYHT